MQNAIQQMERETGRVQKLAIWIGIGGTVAGAVLGAVGAALFGG